MKKLLISIFIGAVLLFGCDFESASDKEMRSQTESIMQEANRQVGMPNITNFQQRKLMKMIYELADQENLITFVYIKSDYQGKLMFIGKAIGYGVPFAAQYTNPEKPITVGTTYRDTNTIPQPDPNGLFMPTSSSATWIAMIDPTTDTPRVVYIEPEIVVSPFPLH